MFLYEIPGREAGPYDKVVNHELRAVWADTSDNLAVVGTRKDVTKGLFRVVSPVSGTNKSFDENVAAIKDAGISYRRQISKMGHKIFERTLHALEGQDVDEAVVAHTTGEAVVAFEIPDLAKSFNRYFWLDVATRIRKANDFTSFRKLIHPKPQRPIDLVVTGASSADTGSQSRNPFDEFTLDVLANFSQQYGETFEDTQPDEMLSYALLASFGDAMLQHYEAGEKLAEQFDGIMNHGA